MAGAHAFLACLFGNAGKFEEIAVPIGFEKRVPRETLFGNLEVPIFL